MRRARSPGRAQAGHDPVRRPHRIHRPGRFPGSRGRLHVHPAHHDQPSPDRGELRRLGATGDGRWIHGGIRRAHRARGRRGAGGSSGIGSDRSRGGTEPGTTGIAVSERPRRGAHRRSDGDRVAGARRVRRGWGRGQHELAPGRPGRGRPGPRVRSNPRADRSCRAIRKPPIPEDQGEIGSGGHVQGGRGPQPRRSWTAAGQSGHPFRRATARPATSGCRTRRRQAISQIQGPRGHRRTGPGQDEARPRVPQDVGRGHGAHGSVSSLRAAASALTSGRWRCRPGGSRSRRRSRSVQGGRGQVGPSEC